MNGSSCITIAIYEQALRKEQNSVQWDINKMCPDYCHAGLLYVHRDVRAILKDFIIKLEISLPGSLKVHTE